LVRDAYLFEDLKRASFLLFSIICFAKIDTLVLFD
jgi:hypothetical protein